MKEPVHFYQTHGVIFYDATQHAEQQTGEPAEGSEQIGGLGYIAVPDITV